MMMRKYRCHHPEKRRVRFHKGFLVLVCCLGVNSAPSGSRGDTLVTNVTSLKMAIDEANSGGDPMILIADGTYTLPSSYYLSIHADDVTIRGQSGNRAAVILEGQGMYPRSLPGSIIHVVGDHFTCEDMTLRNVGNHLVQIHGESNADYVTLRNLIFQDGYEQLVKVSSGESGLSRCGLIENCLFEYTAGIGPNWYIGGIDAHSSTDWIVRSNVFKSIISPGSSTAEHAIHFWNRSTNTFVEQNLIVNCDRGIGFWGQIGYSGIGGTIRNNMIYHDASDPGGFADVGISVENVPNVQIYNNTILQEHGYGNAIEYRFATTTNTYIANNLVNRDIRSRNGGSGTVINNIETAVPTWFIDPSTGNLHLRWRVPEVVDMGILISGITNDFDGDVRYVFSGVDIGADELWPPDPTSVAVGDGTVFSDWRSIEGAHYVLQSVSSLASSSTWIQIGSPVLATGMTVRLEHAVAPAAGFHCYRALMVP